MEVRLHEGVEEFLALAGPVYGHDPVLHTLELTALSAGVPAAAVLLSVQDQARVLGAALQTPPYPLLVTGLPVGTVDCAAQRLAGICPELIGVRGPRAGALTFAAAWQGATARSGSVDVDEQLYRLGQLRPPHTVPGAHRVAAACDDDVLVDWVEQFFVETFRQPRDDAAGRRFVANAVRAGDRFVL